MRLVFVEADSLQMCGLPEDLLPIVQLIDANRVGDSLASGPP